jgi:uncharacterized membrane protein YedE/YeeE
MVPVNGSSDPKTVRDASPLVLPTAEGQTPIARKEGNPVSDFTPVSAFIGGALIGGSAAFFLVVNGRIAGISGVLGGLLQLSMTDFGWRFAFLAGMLLAPFVFVAAGGTLPSIEIDASAGRLVAAGVLVGFGTRLGAGCTSGHGVCGIGRASPRSIAATLVFMATAIVTVFITRHLMGS